MTVLTQLSKRERLLFLATISVVALAGLTNFVISPIAKKWRRLNTQLSTLETKLNRYSIILAQQKVIENRYKVYADNLKIKGSNEEAQAAVLQEIESIARTAGISLTNIVPSNLEDKGFYRKFQVRLELESNILSLSRFLYEIKKSQQLLGVTKLSISAKSGSTDLLRCSLDLIKIFVL